MNPSEVAALVIGKPLSDKVAFKSFIMALENKPEEFLIEVIQKIPDPESRDEHSFDALQMCAVVFVCTRLAAFIAGEVLYSPEYELNDIARKCLLAFPRTWTVQILEEAINKQSGGKPNKGAYYVLGILYAGREGEELMRSMEN